MWAFKKINQVLYLYTIYYPIAKEPGHKINQIKSEAKSSDVNLILEFIV